MSRLSKVFDKAKEETNVRQEKTKARSQEFVNLNFKVDVKFKRKIRQYAANHDMSLKEVFEAALEFYLEHNP